MARTGEQYYPGAIRGRHWYEDSYGGDSMESNVGVMHTTETDSLPGYGGGASAPNLTTVPDFGREELVWYQHFRFDTSSRALVNRAGGVETNTLNAVQVELVGTCDPQYANSWGSRRAGRDYIFWPDAPGWALAGVARFVRWCYDQHQVPMRTDVEWLSYPHSYGNSRVRLTNAQWLNTYGWVGHQHVAENVHGDPGDLDMGWILDMAKSKTWNGDDMAVSNEDARKIADTVWNWDWIEPVNPTESNPYHQAENVLTSMWRSIEQTEAIARGTQKAVGRLTAEGAARDAILATLVDGGGITAEQLEAAAKAGARAALVELGKELA